MKNNILKYGRLLIAWVIGILCVAAFWGKFYRLKFLDTEVAALIQRALVHGSLTVFVLLGAVVILTLLFGRIYCSTLCPLGLFQELMMWIFAPLKKWLKMKHNPQKHYIAAYLPMLVCFGALIGGSVVLLRLLDPYTIAGNALSGAIYGLSFVGLLIILVFFKNRFFCSNICPVGALLGLLARFSLFKIKMENTKCKMCGMCARVCPTGSIDFKNKTVNNETCIKCFKCLKQCKFGSLHYTTECKPSPAVDLSRRQFIKSGGALIVLGLAFKAGVVYSKQVAQKLKAVILPAGAGSVENFADRCLNCNLCVQSCPMKIIKKADSEFPVVHLDYHDAACAYDCRRCSDVCPSGALERLTLAQKQRTKIGTAAVAEDVCVRCGLCVGACPKQAIHKEDGEVPVIAFDACIGCGACQQVCPVKAIHIEPVMKQVLLNDITTV